MFKVTWLGDQLEVLGTAEVLHEDKRMVRAGGCRGEKVEVGGCPRATRLDVSEEVRSGY